MQDEHFYDLMVGYFSDNLSAEEVAELVLWRDATKPTPACSDSFTLSGCPFPIWSSWLNMTKCLPTKSLWSACMPISVSDAIAA